MPFIDSPVDGARLYYADYVPATFPPPFRPTENATRNFRDSTLTVVFIHGWPMSHQMYEHLMVPLCETYGIRCIGTDRRGFGKSDWKGHRTQENITFDVFAQDTIGIIEAVKLERFIFVASSMGCGETLLAYHQMSNEMKERCKGFVWLGPSLPFPLKTDDNPAAPARELWDTILDGFRQDRIGFTRASIPGVFGTSVNIGIQLPETALQKFEYIVAQADALALERCIQIITHRDFTPELKELHDRARLLVVHGDSDRSECEALPFPAATTRWAVRRGSRLTWDGQQVRRRSAVLPVWPNMLSMLRSRCTKRPHMDCISHMRKS